MPGAARCRHVRPGDLHPPDNEKQRYLLSRDGYSCEPDDDIIIMLADVNAFLEGQIVPKAITEGP